MALSLGQIVESLGGRLIGDSQLLIQKLAPLDTAQADALSFFKQSQIPVPTRHHTGGLRHCVARSCRDSQGQFCLDRGR